MGLFQKSVFNNFVQRFAYNAETELKDAFVRFQARFQTPNVQAKILASKEELYQRTFLREFFEEVLGYIHHPKDNHNLEVEKKNPHDAHKVDGVLLKDQHVRVVIELKSTKTHLDTVVEQAFSYLNAHKHAKYVITSNFTHLRFYLDKKDEFEEFDLFNLAYEDFERMYALLCPATILSDAIDRLNQASIAKEEDITKDFYEKYQNFKDALCLNMSVNNKQIDKLLLFEKAQKLLDRIIFMYFASSKGLLPTNHVDVIIKEWSDLVKMRIGGTLFDRFKAHFEFINSGFTSEKYEIYAYNGGLFAKDAVLDKLKIDNDILVYHCGALLQYDYVSEVDVNILGHIFEHSLSQADQKKQEILQKMQDLEAGKEVKIDNQRKVDGIFYTPSYITNYMVEETLGKLCADKKEALGLTTATEQIDLPALTAYKQWLETVSVLDPACGSGAFLNQVLSFFIKEFNWIETLEMSAIGKKGKRGTYINTILDNNIFGVDLNQESVAITKLSLWLKTAQMYQKLNNLNNNIKVGNSLISDTTLHEKAFDWAKEFPKVMKNGGFTLIVGNPPYVSTKLIQENQKKYFLQNFETAKGQFDLYGLFIEKGQKLLQKNGVLSFITSSSFLSNKDFVDLRRFLFEKTSLIEITYLGETVFEQASVDVCIMTFKNCVASKNHEIKVIKSRQDFDATVFHSIRQSRFDLEKNNYEIKLNSKESDFDLIDKIYEHKELLSEILDLPRGIEIGANSDKITAQPQAGYEKVLAGKHIGRYEITFDNMFIQFENDKSVFKDYDIYTQPKILIQRIRNLSLKQRIVATLDTEGYLCTNTLRIGLLKNKNYDLNFVLGVLNSKVVNFIFSKFFLNKDIYAYQLERIPVPKIPLAHQKPIADRVAKILSHKKHIFKSQKDIADIIDAHFGVNDLAKKLDNWQNWSWKDFFTFLGKQKINLTTIKKELEWKNFFEDEKQKTLPIAQESQILENEIDALVYALYDLSPEEIRLIENE